MGNFLIIAFNTNHSHQTGTQSQYLDIEFTIIRSETGEFASAACQNVFSGVSNSVNSLDLVAVGNTGIYMLASFSQGTVNYPYNSLSYVFSDNSYVITLLGLDITTSPTQAFINLLDIELLQKAGPISQYPPVRLFAYNPSGILGYGVPELVLASHLNPITRTGIIFMSFTNQSCPISLMFPASYNPFAISTSCTNPNCQRCLSAQPNMCLDCAATYFLSQTFTCVSSICPNYYYSSDGKTCVPCHSSCQTCQGPLRSQCLTCDTTTRTYNALTQQCQCNVGYPYIIKGQCAISCSSGQSGVMANGNCRDKCPSYTFYYADYSSSIVTTLPEGASEGSDMLQFTTDATSCLKLPGPIGATSIPSAFTVSFWINVNPVPTGTLIWGFNSFVFSSTNTGKITLELIQTSTPFSLVTAPGTLALNTWTYIAASVSPSATGHQILLYAAALNVNVNTLASQDIGNLPLSFATYINSILLGCTGTISTNGVMTTNPGIQFSGNLRDLVFLKRFHGLQSLINNKNNVFSNCLQIYSDVLSYWRFDVITQNPLGGYTLTDMSSSAQSVIITTNPTKNTGAPSLCSSSGDVLGTCVDLFAITAFPKYTVSLDTYAINSIQYRLNMNDVNILSTVASSQDKLLFNYGGCGVGYTILQLGIQLINSGLIQIQSGLSLPNTVYGSYVDVCYFSYSLGQTIKLGQLYVPNIPNHIFPSNGFSDSSTPAYFTFSPTGGDQSIGDVITLFNLENDVATGTQDSILIDDTVPTFSSSSINLQLVNGIPTYSSVSTSSFNPSVYTLLWRPSYLIYQTNGTLTEYKNLFTTWAIQAIPSASFPELFGVAGVYNNVVLFKGQLAYLDLVGPGQSEGDEVIFCFTGCNYQNMQGSVYKRVNGNFPAVWLGEEVGVSNLALHSDYDRVFICWRPAARAAVTNASDDLWSPVPLLAQGHEKDSYLRINWQANNDIPEIAEINPPIENPVLYEGDSIWFTISKCAKYRMKPSSYIDGTPGQVQILHVVYSTLNHSQYTTEIIWQQQFPLLPDASNNGFTVGKLSGDPTTCTYTIMNLQDEIMIPGDTYELIIYSASFKSGYTADYLFGVTTTNVQQFIYKFTYQGAPLNANSTNISPTATQFTINGSRIGDSTVQGNGIVEKLNLFSVNANLYCGNTQIMASYMIRNLLLDNPSVITLTDLDLGSCDGSLTLNLQLVKLLQMYEFPLWSYISTKSTLILGTVSCDQSCSTCNGTTPFDCLTCDVTNTNFSYLYNGQCLTSCPSDAPIAQIIIVPGIGTITYYVCVTSCYIGYYLNTQFNVCLQCNAQCRSCTSGSPGSCIDCPGLPMQPGSANTANTYTELFMFNHLCMTSCPIITNDLSIFQENLVVTYLDTRICQLNSLPQGKHPISVFCQHPAYPDKIDVGIVADLRALVNDPTDNLTAISWSAIPAENLTNTTLFTSEQRTFLTYDPINIASYISTLNMNSFNYKGDNNEMRILLKARTCDSLAYYLFELYGNRAPTILATSVSPTGIYTTLSYINVTVIGIRDSDEAFPVYTFKIQLQPKQLALPDNYAILTTVTASALQMLATLPSITLTLTSAQVLSPDIANNNSVYINNIFIPPLINGPQTVSNLLLYNVTCDLVITCMDWHYGLNAIRVPINFTEVYTPKNRSEIFANLYSLSMTPSENNSMTWEMALMIAHTFRVISPTPLGTFLALSPCSIDNQCNGNGKCVTSGGRSECICGEGFAGPNCAWNKNDLIYAQAIAKSVLLFLNTTVIAPVSNQLTSDANFTIQDQNVITQLSSILSGLLQNPEVVSEDMAPIIAQLCQYMTSIDLLIGGRLQSYEKQDVINAIDVTMQFFYYAFRNSVIAINNMMKSTNDPFVKMLYIEKREIISSVILTLTESLYHFCDMISVAQYPGAAAFIQTQKTFEVFISSENAIQIFANLGKDFGIMPSNTFGTIRFPESALNSLRQNITIDGEFKIRLVKWTENPYIFSEHESEIFSSLMSFSLLDSNSTQLTLNLTEPIVMLLPLSNITKNLYDVPVKCMQFSEANTMNISYINSYKVDVNLLNMSDASKKLMYPQWDPNVFSVQHLIVDENTYQNVQASYPDFIFSDGTSSYGDIFTTSDYENLVICAAYHQGEIVSVVQNKVSFDLPIPQGGFYYQFNPTSQFKYCLGLYVDIAFLSLFCFFFIMSWIADVITIPRLEKLIELHRLEYSERDSDINNSSEIPSIGTQNSKVWLVKQKGKDSEFFDEPMGMEPEKLSQMRKRKGKKIQSDLEIVPNESINDKQQDSTVEKNKLIGDSNASINESRKQDKLNLREKENNEVIIPTQNQTTNQAFTTTPALRTAKNAGLGEEDSTFNEITPDEIRAKGKRTLENIFSDEYIHRRELNQFTVLNMYMTSNLILNAFTVTNILFPRTCRCALLLVNIHLLFTFCAFICSMVLTPLDHADIYNEPQSVSFTFIWISFVVPLVTSSYQYLFAIMYKIHDSKLLKAKILGQYKRYCRDYIRERKVRRILGHIVMIAIALGCSLYDYYFSVIYGYFEQLLTS